MAIDPQAGRAVAQRHIGQTLVPEFAGGIAHRTGQVETVVHQPLTHAHHDIHHLSVGQLIDKAAHPPIVLGGCKRAGIVRGLKGGHIHRQTGNLLCNDFRLPLGRPQLLQGGFYRADGLVSGDDHILRQGHHRRHSGIAGVVAQAQEIITLLQHKAVVPLPEAGKAGQIKFQGQMGLFTGSDQLRLGKGCQGLVFLAQFPCGGRHIQLHHFLAGEIAGIFHLRLQAHLGFIHLGVTTGDGKVRIAQAKSKGIGRFDPEGIEIAVAHIDALFIIFLLQIAIAVAIFIRKGNVAIALSPGIRQLCAGADRTGENVRHRQAALAAGLANIQHRTHALNPIQKTHIHTAAAVHQQHKMPIMGGAEGDGLPLFIGDVVIAGLCPTVATLAGLAGEHIDAGVCITVFHMRLGNNRAARQAEIIEEHIVDGLGVQQIDAA